MWRFQNIKKNPKKIIFSAYGKLLAEKHVFYINEHSQKLNRLIGMLLKTRPCGLVARIRRSHRRGEGSIPLKSLNFSLKRPWIKYTSFRNTG